MRKMELHPRTADINNKQKNQAKKARNEALIWLASFFPKAFDNSLVIRPLKLGIMEDILAHSDKAEAAGISKSKLREAVVIFTRRIDYLTCLKSREMRVDLDGNPVSQVTEDEASKAALKIKRKVENSSKNARKTIATKPLTSSNSKAKEASIYPSEQYDRIPYPLYSQNFDHQNNSLSKASPAPVIIKHKTTRAFDPDAVARMKEKLGLSPKTDITTETT